MENEQNKPKIITFATLKGGTGKTTACFNIAGRIAEKYKILLLDADPQANLSANVGVDITDDSYKFIGNIFENRSISPEEVIMEHVIPELPNLDIIPSRLNLFDTEARLINETGRERFLNTWFKRNMEYLSKYDYIICDTNPNMGMINQNVFFASDHIILVSDIDNNSAKGAEMFWASWYKNRINLEKDDNVAAVLVNNYDQRIKLSRQLKDYFKDYSSLSDLVLEHHIPGTKYFKDTNTEHKPLHVLFPNPPKDETSIINAKIAIDNVIEDLKGKGVL